MAVFTCKTRDTSGTVVERTVDAPSRSAVIGLLEREGLFPVSIAEAAAPGAPPGATAEPVFQSAKRRSDRKIKRKELMNFSVQLSSSLVAGVPILTALRSIRKQTEDKRFQAVLEEMTVDVEGGLSLSGAMQNYRRAFPQVYVRTVAAGEQSGSLDQMLGNLADHLEAEMETLADVRTALLYPVIVISVLCMAIGVLIIFVVPRFTDFYSRFDTELPLPTRLLISTSRLFANYGLFAPPVLVALGYGFTRLLRTKPGRTLLDRLLLRTPLVGRMIETAITLHNMQILGLSCRAGVPLLETLRVLATSTVNTQLRKRIESVTTQVSAGATLADSLESAGCFPPSARQMLASGESTGSLERSCFIVAKHFKRELHYLTKNLATFIEPLLTLVLAGVVLFVALAVFLPMWDLVKVVKG